MRVVLGLWIKVDRTSGELRHPRSARCAAEAMTQTSSAAQECFLLRQWDGEEVVPRLRNDRCHQCGTRGEVRDSNVSVALNSEICRMITTDVDLTSTQRVPQSFDIFRPFVLRITCYWSRRSMLYATITSDTTEMLRRPPLAVVRSSGTNDTTADRGIGDRGAGERGNLCGCRRSRRTELARVRSNNSSLAALITRATEQSATFRGLIDAINVSDGIVYVESGRCRYSRACLVGGHRIGRSTANTPGISRSSTRGYGSHGIHRP